MDELKAAAHGLQKREAQEVDPLLAARQANVAKAGTRQPATIHALTSAEYRLEAPANRGRGVHAAEQAETPE